MIDVQSSWVYDVASRLIITKKNEVARSSQVRRQMAYSPGQDTILFFVGTAIGSIAIMTGLQELLLRRYAATPHRRSSGIASDTGFSRAEA